VTHQLGGDSERLAHARRTLADAIAELVPFGDDEETPTEGVLTVWAVIAEFQATDGTRWLTLCNGNGSGSMDLPRWVIQALGRELRDFTEPVREEEE
jgi:hypothetical protein